MVAAYIPKTELGKKYMDLAAEIRQAAQDGHRTREIYAAIRNYKTTGKTQLIYDCRGHSGFGHRWESGQILRRWAGGSTLMLTETKKSKSYPSGITLPVIISQADSERDVIVIGDLQVLMNVTRDEAVQALTVPVNRPLENHYVMQTKGGNCIQLWRSGQSMVIEFDNDAPGIKNISYVRK